ncbi:streptococcal hemagglutinin-like [Ixodes scapularis]|uniref:streptococcal hemagglutinin-like n=1 Tax=Ixodes scapularis TaxID=6945 RepID=UPI001C393613|nr:streptococcal hemagglutinin-like [Ixodes scapularis]
MKVLKTYGRKFKTSFLEVGKSSRPWSPEVVRVRSPNDRFETIFDSLQAKSKSKVKAAVVTTDTSKGNDDKRQASPCGLFDLTLASKTEERSPLDNFCVYVSSSSPELRPPKIRRAKRRMTIQSPGSSESSSSVAPAVSRKKKRGRPKAKPPPAKRRVRPRRVDAAPVRHALRGARFESSETATSSGLGTGSSSRNWDRRESVAEIASDPAIAMLQKEFSMIEKHELATEACRSRGTRGADVSKSSVPLLLLPESGSSWATARRKRRERGIAEGSSQSPPESRKRMKRLSSERKRTVPQVESGNVVESISGGYLASGHTPLAEAVLPRLGERWSPNFASTPAPQHLQKEVVRGKKAFFLNLLDQSSRASLADRTNSILANDSFACITQHEPVEMLRSRVGCDVPSEKDKDRNSELQDVTWNLHQKDVPPGKLSLLKGLRVTLVDLATESSEGDRCKPQKLSSDLARQDSSKKIVLKELRVNLTDILSQTQGKLKSGGKQRVAKRSKSNGSSRDVLTEILQKYMRVGLTDISPQSKFYPQERATAAATSTNATSTSATSTSATSTSAASPSAASPSASSSSLTSSNAVSSSVTKSLALSRRQSDASSSNYLSSQNSSAEILPRNPQGNLTDTLPDIKSLPSSSSRREPSMLCRNAGSSTSRGLMVNGLTSNLQCWNISTDFGLREVRVNLTRLAPQIEANLGKSPLGESGNIVRNDSSGTDSTILKLSCVTSMVADNTGLQVVQADRQRRFSELSEDHVEESLKKPSLQETRENKLPKARVVSGPSCIAAASPLQREASLSVRRSSLISRRPKTWASIPRKSILPPLAPDPFEMLLDFCRQEEALTFDQALNFK